MIINYGKLIQEEYLRAKIQEIIQENAVIQLPRMLFVKTYKLFMEPIKYNT